MIPLTLSDNELIAEMAHQIKRLRAEVIRLQAHNILKTALLQDASLQFNRAERRLASKSKINSVY